MLLLVILLAIVVSCLTAFLVKLWSDRQLDATAEAQATALARWLAAEASLALRAGVDLNQVTMRVGQEPGVSEAFVLKPEDGRILAPATRGAERVVRLPGLGVAPSEVWRVQTGWNGGQVEAVAPLALPGQPRAAIAWVRFRPAAAGSGPAGMVALALLLAMAIGLAAATVIRGNTERALATFNENVELAAGGRLSQVADTMGVRALADLAETLNYLLVRLRAAEPDSTGPILARRPLARGDSPAVGTPASGTAKATPPVTTGADAGRHGRPGAAVREARTERSAPRAGTSPPPPTPQQASGEARLVASAAYRVTEVTAECARVLGARSDGMIGQHLLDAIPDKGIVEAVLRCLSALPPSGEERTIVSPEGRSERLEVRVRREGKEEPITILLRPMEGVGA